MLPAHVCHRAVEARDPRFDGRFFVAIESTGIYCRPVCPSRAADPSNRRFFPSAAAAEDAGFRPCLRCRPELAPGRALVDAVSRLASSAAERIAAGALNGRSVGQLARSLYVSERHLRRALKQELGISPTDLAQSHRTLTAKRLLADTDLDMSRVAFASGFQSLRRFNAVIKERYGMTPTELRGRVSRGTRAGGSETSERGDDAVRSIELGLAYRPPYAWGQILRALERHGAPGVVSVRDGRYARAVRVGDCTGLVVVRDAPRRHELRVEIASTLVLHLMPLLARLRRLFDLDAAPTVIDQHLAENGLAWTVERCPGVRVPGPFDELESAVLAILDEHGRGVDADGWLPAALLEELGQPLEDGRNGTLRAMPGPQAVAAAGADALAALGVPVPKAEIISGVARSVVDGRLGLACDREAESLQEDLLDVEGMDARVARRIVMRVLHSPDVLDASDVALQGAAGVATPDALRRMAAPWRPWRAYAVEHLWMGAARLETS